MKIYIKNHTFWYELENLTRIFFPNEKIIIEKELQDEFENPYIYTSADKSINVSVSIGGFYEEKSVGLTDDENENERLMAVSLFEILKHFTGITPPWGILTGVRPIKLMRRLVNSQGEKQAYDYFLNSLKVSEEKINLAVKTEKIESEFLKLSKENSFSLYISIPFCPTRCSYCSFVSQSVEKATALIEPYVNYLCTELEYTAKIAADCKLRLETVYMGGGTPTTLSSEQLDRVLSTINKNFDMSTCREFTVEAGRPDTVTREKLEALLKNNVDRISINPQTMNDEILKVIGRKHTAQQTTDAFMLAKSMGFSHINADLIAGLPQESFESFKNSLDTIRALNPESITVHTLCMKRSSNLSGNGMQVFKEDAERAAKMLEYCKASLTAENYLPYYLYRQSRMVGNLENVGWSKKGFEGLYNIYVMDETHTVLGCGAGAVTKLKKFGSEKLERIFNYKYPYEYNTGLDEMLKRKSAIYAFYEK